MSVIGWIILGGLAGWIASIITRRNHLQGCLGNIIVGIVGAIIGGGVVVFLGGQGLTGFNLSSLFIATFGAVILLLTVNIFLGRK